MTSLTSILSFVIFFGKYLRVFWRGILLKLILLLYYVTFVISDIKLRFSVLSTSTKQMSMTIGWICQENFIKFILY
jgi:hypothetical protein